MKRVGFLMGQLVSDLNLELAIFAVNHGHRTHKRTKKPNETTEWVEATLEERKKELRGFILDPDFEFHPTRDFTIYDKSAGKYRDIHEPQQYPDQYLHHAVIQVLEPILMRGMDYWCLGSIKGRGGKRGINGIKKWLKNDPKGTKWCLECDIRHFYDELSPEVVVSDLRARLVKDERFLSFVAKMIKRGICIGAYYSQWFANTVLQPIDQKIRELGASHYARHMDNFTIFSSSKKRLHKIRVMISAELSKKGLRLKDNWQVFKVDDRPVSALGYRFGHGFCMMRKKNVLKLTRQLRRYYKHSPSKCTVHEAQSLISRIGQLKHCDNLSIYDKHYRKGTQKNLKNTIRRG